MSVGLNDTRPFPTTHPSPKETERSLFLILCSQLEWAYSFALQQRFLVTHEGLCAWTDYNFERAVEAVLCIASRDTHNRISEEGNRWQSALNEHGHQARQTSGKLLVWLRLKLDLELAKRALQCTTRLDVLPRDPICRDCFATRRDAFWCYRIGIAMQKRQR